MSRPRRWTNAQLREGVARSTSYRQVLTQLGLKNTGGNYRQVQNYVHDLDIDTAHFAGKAWNKGKKCPRVPALPLEQILQSHSRFQSFKLKKRLFASGLKQPRCELCSWAQQAEDGRIPVELDHINGDNSDNRLENLRILCPNCHSLQPTHRGLNKSKQYKG